MIVAGKQFQTVCPNCRALNRLASSEFSDGAVCVKCGKQLVRASVQTLTDEDFPQALKGEKLPVVVDFWAPWCAPCKRMAPVFEQLCKAYTPSARFAKLNVDNYPKIANRQKVQSIPLLVIYQGGKEIARLAGLHNQKKIQQWLNQHIPR